MCAILGFIGPCGAFFRILHYNMGAIEYVKETRAEMRHVTWPKRAQVAVFTFSVILVSILTSLYLGLFDFLFSRGLEAALSRFGEPTPSSVEVNTEGVPGGASSDAPAFDPEAILRDSAGETVE